MCMVNEEQNSDRTGKTATRRRFIEGTATATLLAAVGSDTTGAVRRTAAYPWSNDHGNARSIKTNSSTLSVTDRLEDRRYVATGTRAYIVGDESGRFPAMGWHIEGEMGGVWSPPLKLLDGIWFGINDKWIGRANRFTSAYGHVTMDLPGNENLSITRTDFVPDGKRAALFGLQFTAGDKDESFTLTVNAHSELLSAYPWGWTTPSQEQFNLEDSVEFDGQRLVFREQGTPPVENADRHNWASVVGTKMEPVSHKTGDEFWGPQMPVDVCPPDDESTEQLDPIRCDDSKMGNGKGGQLQYEVEIPANSTKTIWVGVAGSESGPEPAVEELTTVLEDPMDALQQKVATRRDLAERTQVSLPGSNLLDRSIKWSKQNLADSVQEATDLQIRYTDEGTQYPAPLGEIDRIRFYAAGFPDYQWLFAVDGEYTTFAALAAGQFDVPRDHMRAIHEVSRLLNEDTGKVAHEVITDGSVYYGANSDPGNTDETAKFAMAVHQIWQWTGDDAFRDEMYEFIVDGLTYITEELDEDSDLWPSGQGNVERSGMGEEKLDVTVYTIRGLFALADMARSKGDQQTATWASDQAGKMLAKFVETWWIPEIPQHAGSIDVPENGTNDNRRIYQRHWIGVTPMSVDYVDESGSVVPGIATRDHGNAALKLRETACYSGIGDEEQTTHRRNDGLYHTGGPGCDKGEYEYTKYSAEKSIFTLNSAVMAVGEGNYGRLGRDQQRRYMRANATLQLPDPDEQPGAMPEIAPSPNYGRSINQQFTKRAMVLQAWGTYGILWPVVRHYLGLRPDMGRKQLQVIPQIPEDFPRIEGENIRLGEDGAVAVSATVPGKAGLYRTRVSPSADIAELSVGHVIPPNAEIETVRLDGEATDEYEVRMTTRGKEVSVNASPDQDHVFLVRTKKMSSGS